MKTPYPILGCVLLAASAGALAQARRPASPHTLLVGTTALLTNHIPGRSKLRHTDFTPIASLFNDYVVFAVNANSPIKTGKELAAKMQEDPHTLSTCFA